MKILSIKPINHPKEDSRYHKVHLTIRGIPKKALFSVYVADAQTRGSFLNQEYGMDDATVYYLTVEVPSNIKHLLVRCRDSAYKYQYWERVIPVKEALKQGVSIDIRLADFGKGLADAMQRPS